MVKELCSVNTEQIPSIQLAHVAFVEEILWIKCPSPLTPTVVNRFLDMYLELAYELYENDYDYLCTSYDEWDFIET